MFSFVKYRTIQEISTKSCKVVDLEGSKINIQKACNKDYENHKKLVQFYFEEV